MHPCKSGRHWWTDKEDADKCCDPQWRRVLAVVGPGQPLPADATNIVQDAPAMYGRR
jgi:hypothetical protein